MRCAMDKLFSLVPAPRAAWQMFSFDETENSQATLETLGESRHHRARWRCEGPMA